ncbi:MAG: SpaA isopeptide-forming pilin-related protein [Clostridiales bacterium]|nr:SpaA isopeptide-forming pilin-related protein [Clostridiales bacterium]
MRKNRPILAILIALTLALTALLPVAAVFAAGTGTITITPPAGHSIVGKQFVGFKVFDIQIVEGEEGDTYAYQIVPEFAAFDDYPNSATQSLFKYIESLKTNPLGMEALAKKLYDFADGSVTPAFTQTATTESLVINNLDFGYYLVFGKVKTSVAEGSVEIVAALTLTNVAPTADVTPKADSPTIVKEVKNTDNSPATWGKWADAMMGDMIDFRYITKVPDMTGYVAASGYTFTMHDTLSAGFGSGVMPMDASAFTVTIGASTPFTDFTFDDDGCGSDSFCLIFDAVKFYEQCANKAGQTITIEYSIILNGAAVIAPLANTNEVYLEYSNNPYSESTGVTPEDEVKVFTFDLNVFKYYEAAGNVRVPLPGAKFDLYKEVAGAQASSPIDVLCIGDGEYRVLTGADGVSTPRTVMITDENGFINLKGLDAGVYYLEEVEAPEGYTKLAAPIKIRITHTNTVSLGSSTLEVWKTNAWVNVSPKQVDVLNLAGEQLPETGGIGTILFYVIGLTMAAVIVCGIVALRRRVILHGVK